MTATTPAPDRARADSDAATDPTLAPRPDPAQQACPPAPAEEELGGPQGPEPTRYGDWERKGRCVDF